MNSVKKTVVTSVILTLVALAIGVAAFAPERAVTISASGGYSAIYNGDRNSKTVAFAVNVYENADMVLKMADLLKNARFSATFFVGGCWADDNIETIKTLIEEGFEIGNHGYYHKDHKKLSYDRNLSEIKDCGNLVKSATGYEIKLFAPPSGSFGKETLAAAENLGYKTIMWSKDTIDWRDGDKSVVVKRATKNLTAGDIILMHPKAVTVSALPEIINAVKAAGLNAVTVGECINAAA